MKPVGDIKPVEVPRYVYVYKMGMGFQKVVEKHLIDAGGGAPSTIDVPQQAFVNDTKVVNRLAPPLSMAYDEVER